VQKSKYPNKGLTALLAACRQGVKLSTLQTLAMAGFELTTYGRI